MSRGSLKVLGAAPVISVLAMMTACGNGDTAFESAEDLRSAMESAGHDCTNMTWRPYLDDREDAEVLSCVEGHSLVVWGDDFDPDVSNAGAVALVQDLEEQGLIEHLRGENWHVMSVEGDVLEDLQQRFGGEINEQGFPLIEL